MPAPKWQNYVVASLRSFFRPLSFFFVTGKDLDVEKCYRFSRQDKRVYVDLRLEKYREIYNEWEFAPDAWGDLDEDLFSYLQEFALEIPQAYNLCIAFHLPSAIRNDAKESITERGYRSYFNYRIRKLRVEIRKERKKIFFYLVFGFALLSFAFVTGDYVEGALLHRFLSEGFFVGAWVILWELFSALFFTSTRLMDEYSVLERLRNAGIEFLYDA